MEARMRTEARGRRRSGRGAIAEMRKAYGKTVRVMRPIAWISWSKSPSASSERHEGGCAVPRRALRGGRAARGAVSWACVTAWSLHGAAPRFGLGVFIMCQPAILVGEGQEDRARHEARCAGRDWRLELIPGLRPVRRRDNGSAALEVRQGALAAQSPSTRRRWVAPGRAGASSAGVRPGGLRLLCVGGGPGPGGSGGARWVCGSTFE